MQICVCIKQILDPDIASTIFRVDEDAKKVVPLSGMSPVISPFDEQAVEAALRIKDEHGDAVTITVITMGPESARAVLKAGLAKGADQAVLLADAHFEGADSTTTARVLAAAIRKIGDVDLVLAGRQAADRDDGVVGLGVAEMLGVAAITYARDVRVAEDKVRVVRVLENGTETVEAALPVLVTISHELGKPRYTSLRETMRAARKPLLIWTASDLDLEAGQVGGAGARRVLERLYIPVNDIDCDFIEGSTPQDIADELARRLQQAELI